MAVAAAASACVVWRVKGRAVMCWARLLYTAGTHVHKHKHAHMPARARAHTHTHKNGHHTQSSIWEQNKVLQTAECIQNENHDRNHTHP